MKEDPEPGWRLILTSGTLINMTKKEYEDFIIRLKQFCLDAGFEIAGTCENEGIFGEITVVKVSDKKGWTDWDERKFNFEPDYG